MICEFIYKKVAILNSYSKVKYLFFFVFTVLGVLFSKDGYSAFLVVLSISYFEIMTRSYIAFSLPAVGWISTYVGREKKYFMDMVVGTFFYGFHVFVAIILYFSAF